MYVAKYQGETYRAIEQKEGIEIIIRQKKDGFLHMQDGKEIISYKTVQENELDEMYTVCYSVIWKSHEFEPMYGEKNHELMLYTTKYDTFTCENNFTEIDRGELYKIVPIEECENFRMIKVWYEKGKKSREQEFFLTAEEFIASYYENVTRIH